MGLDIYIYSQTEAEGRLKIADFRKLNAFFNWIDTHVNKIENCVDIQMTKKDFINLHATLNRLNKINCDAIFPTEEGYFFGSQEYDDWYWQDIETLKKFVEKTLTNFNFDTGKIYFLAWW